MRFNYFITFFIQLFGYCTFMHIYLRAFLFFFVPIGITSAFGTHQTITGIINIIKILIFLNSDIPLIYNYIYNICSNILY